MVSFEDTAVTSMRGLRQKRVLVTGGTSGIGAATAARFLDEGAQVVVWNRDASARDRIQRQMTQLSAALACDVSDRTQVQAAIAATISRMGGIDVLVNNAGISLKHRFLDITSQEWQRVLATNLTGAFYVAQAAAQHMMDHQGGVILNMASTNGLRGYSNYAAYNATKAALIELSQSMALELAPKVRVLAIAPGFIMTPMQQEEYTAAQTEEVNRRIPLRRHGQPEEVAALCAFLASEDAAFISGQTYTIDGAEIVSGPADL